MNIFYLYWQPVSPYGETGSLVIDDESIYDPCFLLPLFSTLLSSSILIFLCTVYSLLFLSPLSPSLPPFSRSLPFPPSLSIIASVVNCLSFIKRGLLSFIVTATSSTCVHMRKAAYYNLSLFNHHLTNSSRFTEKPQV